MAESGQLVCVLAGPSPLVERIKPYTKGVMARENLDFSGQAPGQASLMKLLGNTFVLQMVETLGEGHTVAEKTGLGVQNMHDFVQIMFPGPFAAYSNRMISGDYYQRDTVRAFTPFFSNFSPKQIVALKVIGYVLKHLVRFGARIPVLMPSAAPLLGRQRHQGRPARAGAGGQGGRADEGRRARQRAPARRQGAEGGEGRHRGRLRRRKGRVGPAVREPEVKGGATGKGKGGHASEV